MSFGKLEVSNDNSEPDGNQDEKTLELCAERSSVTLYKLKQKRNCTALQLLGDNTKVATKNDVSVSKELNVVQQLSLKHKSFTIRFTDDTENKSKHFSRRNVGSSLYPMLMMIDVLTTFLERQIECLSRDRLANENNLTYFLHSQSTLMRNCVAEQILGNWLETLSTYLEIYSLDVEIIMEVELNELKHFCITPFEGSKAKQSVELSWNHRTLMMEFVMIGKTMTWYEKTVTVRARTGLN